MKIIAVRHGERDYAPCYERGFIGLGLELAPLTELGSNLAKEAANDPRLSGSQIIVSSPYTRCMQTAAIISRIINVPLTVEVDLHEWLPDINFLNKPGEGKELGADFNNCKGRWPEGETRRWETIDMMSERLIKTLEKYLNYNKIIIVIHGMLMHQLKPYGHIPNCFVDEIDFYENFKSPGWVDEVE